MRTLVASALFVYLTAGVFAQEPDKAVSAERIEFRKRQVQLIESYSAAGDYSRTESALREFLASEPPGTLSYARIQNRLGDLLREEGRDAEARPIFSGLVNSKIVVSIDRINALMGLADVDIHEGDFKTSAEEWNAALELARREQDSAGEAAALRGLGRAWVSVGSAARGEPLLRHSVAILSNLSNAPLELAASLEGMAELYISVNKLGLAEDALARAIKLEQSAFGENHPQTAFLMEQLSHVYSLEGQSGVAVDQARRAADVMRQWFGEGSPVTAASLFNLALAEQRANTLNAAAGHFEAAIRVLRGSPELVSTLKTVVLRYAELLKTMHRDQEAKALSAEAKAFRSN